MDIRFNLRKVDNGFITGCYINGAKVNLTQDTLCKILDLILAETETKKVV
jgi:hypothetical protein